MLDAIADLSTATYHLIKYLYCVMNAFTGCLVVADTVKNAIKAEATILRKRAYSINKTTSTLNREQQMICQVLNL